MAEGRGGLNILFEDDSIIVVNKPAGMVVHPSPGFVDGTLSDALVAHCPTIAGVGSVERPGIVHRLDRETSGVMVAAKTDKAYRELRRMFESHTKIRKTYLAVTHGAPKERCGTVRNLIGRKSWDSKRMAVVPPGADGKLAITHWEVLAKHNHLALIEFVIETGRTHQIRVHARHLGCPIAGDSLYGDKTADQRLARCPPRLLLHAVGISFPHPITGKEMSFFAEPPPEITFAG